MTKATQIRMDDELFEKIKMIAEKQNRSINKQIIHTLTEFVEGYEKYNGKLEIEEPISIKKR